MSKHILRITLDIIIFLCLIQGWWYFALLLGLIGLWNLELYIEIILAGLIYDALYGSVATYGVAGSVGLIVGAILFAVLVVIKKVVRVRE